MNRTKTIATVIVLTIAAASVLSINLPRPDYGWSEQRRQDCVDEIQPRIQAVHDNSRQLAREACAAEEATWKHR